MGIKSELRPEAAGVRATLDAIRKNQREFEQTRSLRQRHRLLAANERLFGTLGITFPPIEQPRGLFGWWIRREQHGHRG